jgi:putative transposase
VSRFIDEHRGRFGVEPICSTLGVSASAYYQRASAERSARAVGDERLLEQIEAVHAANYHCYGYRRTWLALTRAGVDVGRDRVKRLLREAGIQGAKRRGKPWRTTIPDPAAVRAPDRVNRDFSASGSDRLWVADFCSLRCWDGVVFFAFVIDVFSRRVVGWQLAGHMRTDLVLDALRMALSRRRAGADVELVHHSDAGSQPGLKRSLQHRVIGERTVASEGTRRGSGVVCRAAVVAEVEPVGRGRSGDSRAARRCGGPVALLKLGVLECVRPQRPGTRRGPLRGCAIRASCVGGC